MEWNSKKMKLIIDVDEKKLAALMEWLQQSEFVRILSSPYADELQLSAPEIKLLDERSAYYKEHPAKLIDWVQTQKNIK